MRAAGTALFAVATLVAGAGCSGPGSDASAKRLCTHVSPSHVVDYGTTFTANGHARLVVAYASTGRVLNTWDPSNQEHPTYASWRGEADGRLIAACWFDGSFRTADGRTYERALIETDGNRSRLVVADKRSMLSTSRPPRR